MEERPIRAVAALPLALAAAPALADDDAQLWTSYQVSGPVAGPLLVQADLAVRGGDRARGLMQVDIAAVVGTEVARGVTLYGGYVRSLRYAPGAPTPVEERLRTQLVGDLGTVGGGALALRLRGEGRWRNDGADTAWRGRAQLKWTRPLRRGAKTALVLAHESYVNLNTADWGPRAGYDRVRSSVGVLVPVAEGVRAEIGYLNQYRIVRRGPDLSEHAAQIALSWSL